MGRRSMRNARNGPTQGATGGTVSGISRRRNGEWWRIRRHRQPIAARGTLRACRHSASRNDRKSSVHSVRHPRRVKNGSACVYESRVKAYIASISDIGTTAVKQRHRATKAARETEKKLLIFFRTEQKVCSDPRRTSKIFTNFSNFSLTFGCKLS